LDLGEWLLIVIEEIVEFWCVIHHKTHISMKKTINLLAFMTLISCYNAQENEVNKHCGFDISKKL